MEKQKDTNFYLDRLKAALKLPSDRQLAIKLGITTSRMSNYRNTSHNMDDDLSLRVEKLLKLPAGSILLEMQALRTKCPIASNIFKKLSKQINQGKIALSICFFSVFFTSIKFYTYFLSGFVILS